MDITERRVELDIGSRRKDVRLNVASREPKNLTFSISTGGAAKEAYDGPYSVVSEVGEVQLLPTENKLMTENIVVMPIPYYETSNVKGGLTVYIGGD